MPVEYRIFLQIQAGTPDLQSHFKEYRVHKEYKYNPGCCCLSICRWNLVFLFQNFTLAYMRQISEMVRPFLGLLAFWRKCLLCNVFTLRGASPYILWVFISLEAVRRIWEWSEQWILLAELCGSSMARSLYFSSRSRADISILFQIYGRCTVEKTSHRMGKWVRIRRPKLIFVTGLITF